MTTATDHCGTHCSRGRRGAALLAVLWLAAALSAIAFTLANSVRGEIERSSTDADGLKAYYLAAGAIDRTLVYVQSGPQFLGPDGNPMYQIDVTRELHLNFPSGVATVDVIPENSKLNVNLAPPGELMNLLEALGVDPERAQAIVAGIVDWRSGTPGGSFTQFDQYYMSLTPSFQARHASFQEIEELLLVRGVTPDLFYGGYSQAADGRLIPHNGLRDCLSVYGSTGTLDVNAVVPETMVAVGVPPATAAAIVAFRKTTLIRNMSQLAAFTSGGRVGPLGIINGPITTFRATARLRLPNGQLSDVRRTVSAMVKFLKPGFDPPFHVLRWYDNPSVMQ
jgi:general secretion pathway protein K